MRFLDGIVRGRMLVLAALAVGLLFGTASAKTLCNKCKGTGKILEVTKQCPLHQPMFGHCANCDGSGLIGPPCPYCEGRGYILTPAEKEAERKARAQADAKAKEEHDAEMARRAVEQAREDSIKRVEKAKKDSIEAICKASGKCSVRTRANIQSVVTQNFAALRYAYNQRLRENPNLTGKITVRFAINEFGRVIFDRVVESTVSDSALEATVVSRVKGWQFGKVNNPGDIIEGMSQNLCKLTSGC